MLRGCAKQYKKDAAQNVQRIKKHRAPEKAADCLQYERMYESGICEVEPGLYSLTMAFTDVNFQLARQEEQNVIFAKSAMSISLSVMRNSYAEAESVGLRVSSKTLRR